MSHLLEQSREMPEPTPFLTEDIHGYGRPVEPDRQRALNLVQQLMAIPGPSGQEAEVARFVTDQLLQAGAKPEWFHTDTAHQRTSLAGDTGNLIFKLPGTARGSRRLLSAHLDTVPICVGCKPVRDGEFIRSANPATGLGADNRAGVAVLLTAARELLEREVWHPPLTFCWFVQEEVGLQGARHMNRKLLGTVRLAFNWDGGSPAKLTVGATGGYRMQIEIQGQASHAGAAPEQGVSAIAIAALAIADLQRNGWHGAIEKSEGCGTSNVGVIQGGQATNVVTDRVVVEAEARSHDPQFRQQIVAEIQRAFERAAQQVKNVSGDCGQVRLDGRLDYESFRLADEEPCVRLAETAVRAVGRQPQRAIANGGLDANWLTAYRIPTVTIGCGQIHQHTVHEALHMADFYDACRIALRLATGTESYPL